MLNPIPLTAETAAVARRVIWFEEPEQALADPVRFLAYAMTYATHPDWKVLRRFVTQRDLREALERAPPGIMDARSWSYWNVIVDRSPVPPMPERRFPDVTEAHSSPERHAG